MNHMIRPAPVRRSVTVKAGPQKAFEVFTAGISRWWPRSHTVGATPPRDVLIEPRVGGRWFEVAEDGQECDWGRVLAYEPPTRLLLSWQLGANWRFDPDLHTEVEVLFTRLEDGGTLVELEHRGLEAYGERAEEIRGMIDSPGGWLSVLEAFGAEADGNSAAGGTHPEPVME